MATKVEEHEIEQWKITGSTSHILPSQCSGPPDCDKPNAECAFCRYSTGLSVPHLPEMVFAGNILRLSRAGGYVLEFNAFDALSKVIVNEMPLHVPISDAWKASRHSSGFTESYVHPFDWTYSTDYPGTLSGDWVVKKTDLQIDYERLKQREPILFFKEIILYEDELHDNGIAKCSVKIRVMSFGFFILCRYFLRVDDLIVRIKDTRLYHEFQNNYILRESNTKQANLKDLNLPYQMVREDEPSLPSLLPEILRENSKLIFQRSE